MGSDSRGRIGIAEGACWSTIRVGSTWKKERLYRERSLLGELGLQKEEDPVRSFISALEKCRRSELTYLFIAGKRGKQGAQPALRHIFRKAGKGGMTVLVELRNKKKSSRPEAIPREENREPVLALFEKRLLARAG